MRFGLGTVLRSRTTMTMSDDPTTKTVTPSGASSRGSHRLACVAQCERKWFLRYVHNLRPVDEPEFRLLGTLQHDAIAYHYAQRMINESGKTPTWWTGKTLDEILEEAGRGAPHLVDAAKTCGDAYADHWQGEDWEPLAVEEEFKATIGELDPGGGDDRSLDSEIVTCRSDLVVRVKSSGMVFIVDHKTKGGGWGTTGAHRLPKWKDGGEYQISWQAMINLYLVRLAYPNEVVRGFIINRVKRKPPFDFDRHVLTISPRAYAAVPRVIRAQIAKEREVLGMVDADIAPRPSYWQCYGRFGPCDYIDICSAKDEDEMNYFIQRDFIR